MNSRHRGCLPRPVSTKLASASPRELNSRPPAAPRSRPLRLRALAWVVAALAPVGAAGCGSSHSNSAASSSSAPSAPAAPTPAAPPARTHPATPPRTGTNQAPPAEATKPPRRAVPPTTSGAGAQGSLASAIATVSRLGYTVSNRHTYRPQQTLKVLVGIATGSSDARVQRAFFFEGDRYLGTDTSDPSASVRVVAQSDTSVTLAYRLYRPRDPLCCPTGGEQRVQFALDNGALSPMGPIPSSSSRAALSRR